MERGPRPLGTVHASRRQPPDGVLAFPTPARARGPAPRRVRALVRALRLGLGVGVGLWLAAAGGGGCGHPASPAAPPAGELKIAVEPAGPGTEVLLDGETALEVPPSGTLSVRVPPATYRVQIERDGFYTVYRLVEVPPPPRPAELRVTLHEVLE
ncbi:MAG TPA: hypothetical protein VG389_06810 [Myxococcota bacterium]|jgi:hypothetical protein|nr:hypothetical protein [Myxococcota bacterium]